MPLTAGVRLGPYTITSALGAGGMGEVYRARDGRLDRDVAIKVLASTLAADPRFTERFEREARVVASLNHPHICTLYDIGEHEGAAFLVMEYLEGDTLGARLARERVPFDTALGWAIQAADALALAHSRGVVHRDLKPANLFVLTSGAIKVLDFGLAKAAGAAMATLAPTMAVTDVGTAVGTVAYMSPEQARGEPIDARSDVFSFGAVLYEMAAGQAAFGGATTAVIFEAILNRVIRPLREAAPDVPADFSAVIDRMLAKRAADRFPDGEAILTTLRDVQARRASSRPGSGPVAARTPSIAVLPFADMSAQRDQDYFCEGMAEELINALSKLQGLRVASRTSAFRFKGAQDIRTIGEQLGVETVLEGSVRTAGARLRVTTQLTSVADGYQIWSERYDRQMEDVFDIQDEIAKAIVGALKVKLLGDADAAIVKRATENVEAYHLCLKARYHWFKWTDEGFAKAVQLFEQALAIDPQYPLAIFGLADSYIASAVVGIERDPFTCESMFETALRLDPELAEAHAILGLVQGMWTWRWLLAQQHFDTAMRLGPRSSHVLGAHGLHLSLLGQFEEAVALGRRGVELDPLMPFWNVMLTQVYVFSRRYDEAIRQGDATLELVPTYWLPHAYVGLGHAAQGNLAEAVAALERAVTHSGGAPYIIGWLGFVLAKTGRLEAADAQLQILLDRARKGYVPAMSVACIYAGLNDRERALASLDRAYAQKDICLSWHVGPLFIFDDLRSDPRFADLHRRVFGT